MDSSVSRKDEIWFLRVCHHVPHELDILAQHCAFYIDRHKAVICEGNLKKSVTKY